MREPITNAYNFIDYKAPIAKSQSDFRTSTYLGHRNFTCPEQSVKTAYIDASHIFRKNNAYYPAKEFETETQSKFISKSSNTSNYITIPQSAKNVHYIKDLEETKLKYVPRQINIYNESTYRQSYKDFKIVSKPQQPSYLQITIPNPVRKSNTVINPQKPGYIKYLDLMATTNMLTYVEHSDQDLYNAKNDITFWNWTPNRYITSPTNEVMCDSNISRLCSKVNKFAKQIKFVPNTGLTTEMKANFKVPGRKFDIQTKSPDMMEMKKKSFQIQSEIQEIPQKTEYSIYGSGDRIQKYLDVSNK